MAPTKKTGLHVRYEDPSRGMPHDSPLNIYGWYEQIVARANDVFGDEIIASRWLSTPNADLKGETPLQALQRFDYNTSVIEPLFLKIEHGVYF